MAFAYVVLPFALFFIIWLTLARYNKKRGKTALWRHALGFFWGTMSWVVLVAIFITERWYTDIAGLVFFLSSTAGCWVALNQEQIKTDKTPLPGKSLPVTSISEEASPKKLKHGRLDKSSAKKVGRGKIKPKPIQTFTAATSKPSSGVPASVAASEGGRILGKYKKSEIEVISFTYSDAKGDISDREVTITKINSEHLTAYCHKAKAIRTFRTDRVLGGIILTSSGEWVDADQFINYWISHYAF